MSTLNQIRQAFNIPDSVVIMPQQQVRLSEAELRHVANEFGISNVSTADSLKDVLLFTNVEFSTDKSWETNTPGVFKTFPKLKYDGVLMSVSQAKKIIKTEIQGRDGTVKEYIGMDDYIVQVNGIIAGKNRQAPINEVALLKQMLDAPIPIDVSNSFLQNLGIVSLVVDSYELGQQAGGYSYQTFAITFLSDIPQELRISNV